MGGEAGGDDVVDDGLDLFSRRFDLFLLKGFREGEIGGGEGLLEGGEGRGALLELERLLRLEGLL